MRFVVVGGCVVLSVVVGQIALLRIDVIGSVSGRVVLVVVRPIDVWPVDVWPVVICVRIEWIRWVLVICDWIRIIVGDLIGGRIVARDATITMTTIATTPATTDPTMIPTLLPDPPSAYSRSSQSSSRGRRGAARRS